MSKSCHRSILPLLNLLSPSPEYGFLIAIIIAIILGFFTHSEWQNVEVTCQSQLNSLFIKINRGLFKNE